MSITPNNSSERAPAPPTVTRIPAVPEVVSLAFVPPFMPGRGVPQARPTPLPDRTPAPVEAVVVAEIIEPVTPPEVVTQLEPGPHGPVPAETTTSRPPADYAVPAPWWGTPAPSVSAPASLSLDAAAPPARGSEPVEEREPVAHAWLDDDEDVFGGETGDWNMLDEEGSAEPAYGDETQLVDGGPAEFPLDAFIIPEHAKRLPTGYEEEYAAITERVADRLEDLARQIRARGISSFGHTHDTDELSRIIAAIVAGYVGHAH